MLELPKEYIVDDNSNINPQYISDSSVKVGVVRESFIDIETGDIRYVVEFIDRTLLRPSVCIPLFKFGGLYNYEQFNLKGFGFEPQKNDNYAQFSLTPGDRVLIAMINGNINEGVILGSLTHPGKIPCLQEGNDNIAYVKEFNGMQEWINKYGEYRVTFRGMPTNVQEFNKERDTPYPEPEYDTKIGSSYYQFDKNGSYLLNDNSEDEEGPQYIYVNKKDSQIRVVSGKTSLTIDKKEESYVIKNRFTTFNSDDEWNLNTKKTTIKSSESIEASTKRTTLTSSDLVDVSTKETIINSSESIKVETRETILKSSDSIEVESAKIDTKGEWSQEGDMDVEGAFSTSGETLLAGGAHPLVYDIESITGTDSMGGTVTIQRSGIKFKFTKRTKAS